MRQPCDWNGQTMCLQYKQRVIHLNSSMRMTMYDVRMCGSARDVLDGTPR